MPKVQTHELVKDNFHLRAKKTIWDIKKKIPGTMELTLYILFAVFSIFYSIYYLLSTFNFKSSVDQPSPSLSSLHGLLGHPLQSVLPNSFKLSYPIDHLSLSCNLWVQIIIIFLHNDTTVKAIAWGLQQLF